MFVVNFVIKIQNETPFEVCIINKRLGIRFWLFNILEKSLKYSSIFPINLLSNFVPQPQY